MIGHLLVGLAMSASSGLGYAHPSYGSQVSGEAGRARGEFRLLAVEKKDGGSGWATTAFAEFEVIRTRRFSAYAGADGAFQAVENYDSQRLSPRADFIFRTTPKSQVSAYWIGPGQKVRRVVGASVLVGRRPAVQIDAEMIRHDDGEGKRVAAALLWRF